MGYNLGHGYRLVDSTDVWDFINTFRETMNPVRDRLDAKLILDHAVALIDHADRSPNGPASRPPKPLATACIDYEDDQASQQPGTVWHDPHSLSLSIRRDPTGHRIHVLLMSNHPDFTEAFEAMPHVEEYAYWDGVGALRTSANLTGGNGSSTGGGSSPTGCPQTPCLPSGYARPTGSTG